MRLMVIILALVAVVLSWWRPGWNTGSATALTQRIPVAGAMAADSASEAGYRQASGSRVFTFPADHGPHDGYRTEWWYLVGNLQAADGRRFGVQITLFRNALSPDTRSDNSATPWAQPHIFMGHLAVSDIATETFHHGERFSRPALGISGAQTDPPRVWVRDWSLTFDSATADAPHGAWRIRGTTGDQAERVHVDLRAAGREKGVVLRGQQGLSQKSAAAGNASWYYAMPRLHTSGTISIGDQAFAVDGLTWLDREWSTSALGSDQVGWDWFALHLDDGRDLMVYRMRLDEGGADPTSHGGLTLADGSEIPLQWQDMELQPLSYWTSPHSGGRYPLSWRIHVPEHGIDVRVDAAFADQEHTGLFGYWEGSVDVTDPATGASRGSGYLEMTGYADGAQRGR